MLAVTVPRIGVVIPAFNAHEFLPDALASVHAQTVTATSVIVVDDCSQDDTVVVARRHGAQVVALPENSGPASARNAGVRALPDCEYVAFLDADDVWIPQHLEILLRGFSTRGVGLVHSLTGFMNAGAPPESSGGLDADAARDALEELLRSNTVSQSSVAVRVADFWAVGGYGEGLRFAEDYDLWLRLAAETRFVRVPRQTSLRRLHEAQASRHSARLLRGAHEARKRGITFARSRGRSLDEETIQRSELEMAREVLGWASYHGDMSLVRELFALHPRSTPTGQFVAHWWRFRRFAWPAIVARAALRHRIFGVS